MKTNPKNHVARQCDARPLRPLVATAILLLPLAVLAQTRLSLFPSASTGITLKEYNPPAGPPPQGIGFDWQGTYGVIAKIVWKPAPNAVSYFVTRRFAEDPACCNASSGPLTTTSWTDTDLLKKGTYMFKVSVSYADGSVGSGEFGVAMEGVRNPSPVTAEDIGPGRVRLNFNNAIPGTSGFLVGGPGLGAGKIVTSGPVETALLSPGTHTWTVASVYSGLGVLSPASDWSRVTHKVAYGSGRFRISLERFKAIRPTVEDLFRADGRGDEIYITTQVNEYGANAKLVSSRMLRTPTFGDVQHHPRIRAGSLSSTGGIQANDEYPAAVEYVSQLLPASTTDLPYLLWEGELSEINGLVILSPAIWESDEDDRLLPHFMTFQAGAAPDVPYRNAFQNYVPWTLGGRPVIDTWNPRRNCPPPLGNGAATMFVPPVNGWGDQPIDMNPDNSYCPTYVAINWRVANSLTSVNPAGVVEIPFTAPSPDRPYQYKLYVRVEKVAEKAPFAAVVAPAGIVKARRGINP